MSGRLAELALVLCFLHLLEYLVIPLVYEQSPSSRNKIYLCFLFIFYLQKMPLADSNLYKKDKQLTVISSISDEGTRN